MTIDQLFATFILNEDIEIAIPAEHVIEAITLTERLLPLPGGVDFLAGLMNLRGMVVPVIDLKKRLHISVDGVDGNQRIAVVQAGKNVYGLLIEDIKDVLRVQQEMIEPISLSLQGDDRIISGIIKLEQGRRLLQILDLNLLVDGEAVDALNEAASDNDVSEEGTGHVAAKSSKRYLIFTCSGMEYGVSVSDVQEITTVSELDATFQSGCIEGAIELRGNAVPVVDSHLLLNDSEEPAVFTPESRVVVLSVRDVCFGILVDEVKEIRMMEDEALSPVPFSEKGKGAGVLGVFHLSDDRNIMLLGMETMLADELAELDSVAKMNSERSVANDDSMRLSHHLITENSYLVFKVERDFAVELHHVQEILENCRIMPVPDMNGTLEGIIDLRGQMVPVVNLRHFYGYPQRNDNKNDKYVVAQSGEGVVALAVDDIITIQKQEKYFHTPSLNPQLRPRQDTLDRTIEMMNENEISENVLVVNVQNLMANHL